MTRAIEAARPEWIFHLAAQGRVFVAGDRRMQRGERRDRHGEPARGRHRTEFAALVYAGTSSQCSSRNHAPTQGETWRRCGKSGGQGLGDDALPALRPNQRQPGGHPSPVLHVRSLGRARAAPPEPDSARARRRAAAARSRCRTASWAPARVVDAQRSPRHQPPKRSGSLRSSTSKATSDDPRRGGVHPLRAPRDRDRAGVRDDAGEGVGPPCLGRGYLRRIAHRGWAGCRGIR